MTRLEILKGSLEKKKAAFKDRLEHHYKDVSRANGQPLNDKRNGHVTLNRWDRQCDSLRNLDEEIKKTERAIEREEERLERKRLNAESIPDLLRPLVEDGTLTQWQRHPNRFFVKGVDHARIIWDGKKGVLLHKYTGRIKDREQFETFRKVYNSLNAKLREATA